MFLHSLYPLSVSDISQSPFLSSVQGACTDTLQVSNLLFIQNSQSTVQPSWFLHKPSSHTLGSLHSITDWSPLETEALKRAGVWVASPGSDNVSSQSFSFTEDFYQVLNRTPHKTTSEPPASHEIWQLAGRCTHTNTCTQKRQVLQFPFPRNKPEISSFTASECWMLQEASSRWDGMENIRADGRDRFVGLDVTECEERRLEQHE